MRSKVAMERGYSGSGCEISICHCPIAVGIFSFDDKWQLSHGLETIYTRSSDRQPHNVLINLAHDSQLSVQNCNVILNDGPSFQEMTP
jgi:hypothetical protein